MNTKMKTLVDYKNFVLENTDNFDFKSIFLELTEYTIPYGYEETLEPILYRLVPNLQKDSFGNYHITISNSRTLFTSHLDTYSKRYEKINHVIRKGVIKTDEKTVLGGDNKNGVLILLYMIQNQVPGTYYFFIGEEGIVTGESCNGSNAALKDNPELFENFDRVIAFDRRGKGSIVVRQRGLMCCSDDFADALVDKFGENGLKFQKDFAYGTDSAVFMGVIPEITNISSSGEYEHAFLESTNIKYLKKVANAAINMNWEDLPIERIPTYIPEPEEDNTEYEEDISTQSKKTFNRVFALMRTKGFNCINSWHFLPNRTMYFSQYIDINFVNMKIYGDEITVVDHSDYMKDFQGGNIQEFKKYFALEIKDFVKGIIGGIIRNMNIDYEITMDDLNDVLEDYEMSYNDFKNYIEDSEYKEYFKFFDDKVYMDVRAGQSVTIKRQQEQKDKTYDKI